MDGILMSLLHENLRYLSDENFETLRRYYETGTLSWQDQLLILNDLTKHKAITPEQSQYALRSIIQQAEITSPGSLRHSTTGNLKLLLTLASQ